MASGRTAPRPESAAPTTLTPPPRRSPPRTAAAPRGGAAPGGLFLLGLAEGRRLGQGEEQDLLAGDGADFVVQAQRLDASDPLDHRLHEGPGRLDQVGVDVLRPPPHVLLLE